MYAQSVSAVGQEGSVTQTDGLSPGFCGRNVEEDGVDAS